MPTVKDVFNDVETEHKLCRDAKCFMGQIGIDRLGRLAVMRDGEDTEFYPLNDWSASQLCKWTGIPYAYFQKIPPEIQAKNVEYWAKTDKLVSKDMLIRLKNRDVFQKQRDSDGTEIVDQDGNPVYKKSGNEDFVRGILSDKYSVFSNMNFMEIVEGALFKEYGDDVQIDRYWIGDKSFHMRVLFPTSKEDVKGPEDSVLAGLHFGNSEVGYRKVTVDLMAWRQVCANGMIGLVSGDSWFKHKHIGMNSQDMRKAILNIVKDSREQYNQIVGDLRELTKSEIIPDEDAEQAIQVVGAGLPKGFLELVKNEFIDQEDRTQYGLLNAFTSRARELNPDDRLAVEMNVSNRLLKAA